MIISNKTQVRIKQLSNSNLTIKFRNTIGSEQKEIKIIDKQNKNSKNKRKIKRSKNNNSRKNKNKMIKNLKDHRTPNAPKEVKDPKVDRKVIVHLIEIVLALTVAMIRTTLIINLINPFNLRGRSKRL